MAVAERLIHEKPYVARSFNQLCKSALGANWAGVDQYMNMLSAPLAKALATSTISGFADGTNLVLQNLDSIMTSVLFTEDQLVKQRWIERVPSINPIYQWNRRNQYGSSRGATAFAEGGIGPIGLGAWERDTQPVKFFGVQRGTTVIANLAGALGGMFDNPVAEEEYDGTMQLLGSVEHALAWGNNTIKDAAGNTVFYDGLYRQLKAKALSGKAFPDNVIDMHGKPMSFDVINNIVALAAKKFVTTARDMAGFLSPDSLQTLQLMKTLGERRIMGTQPVNDGGYVAGTPIKGYDTNIGFIPFIQDVFLDPFDGGKSPLATTDSGAPVTPSGVTASAGAPGGTQVSNWLSTDCPVTVYYTVSAYSASGESLGFTTVAGTAVSAGQVVTVTIPNVSGAWAYRVYRGIISSGSDAQWIGEIASSGGANVAFVDDNSIMPGNDIACFLNRNTQNMVIAQMAPLLKLPLAIQNTTIPFGLLYLHTLAVKAAERQFLVINIGKTGYTL